MITTIDTAVSYKFPTIWDVAKLFALIIVAVWVSYFAPSFVAPVFYAGTLFAYYRSKNEAFWLVFYLVLSDGFFGFFGLYQALVSIIPGLPAVEVGQFYIILTIIKAMQKKEVPQRPFFHTPLQIMLIYLLFLIVQGYAVGISFAINVQFRIVKLLLPLFLLYSIPRLFVHTDQYRALFAYLFPIAFVALMAQVFTILMSMSPAQFFGIEKNADWAIEVTDEKTYRGMYNENILILTYFGAFFYIVQKKNSFNYAYLLSIIVADFLSVFLSATRGWAIGFGFVLFASVVFVFGFSSKRMLFTALVGLAFFIGIQSIPVIRLQINNAYERMLTLEALAGGDITAGGTLSRLDERGPRVMKVWAESPLTGWGFSNTYLEHDDVHVGNQNILLHSGIIGALLIAWFFAYFSVRLYLKAVSLPAKHSARKALKIFIIYLIGWFIIHTSSEQLFGYIQYPATGIIQAVFFSLAALFYNKIIRIEPDENKNTFTNQKVEDIVNAEAIHLN